jgi:hypothetical protein
MVGPPLSLEPEGSIVCLGLLDVFRNENRDSYLKGLVKKL